MVDSECFKTGPADSTTNDAGVCGDRGRVPSVSRNVRLRLQLRPALSSQKSGQFLLTFNFVMTVVLIRGSGQCGDRKCDSRTIVPSDNRVIPYTALCRAFAVPGGS